MKLFGVNIAKLVNSAVAAAGGVLTGSLSRATAGTRTSGSLTAGTNATYTSYNFKGFVEGKSGLQQNTSIITEYPVVSILGDSITVEPRPLDVVTIGSRTYALVELLKVDPAKALYEFKAVEK